MKKFFKIIAAGVLVAGLTPYRILIDRETGAYELESLLWSMKKSVGKEQNRYVMELLPLIGRFGQPAEESAEASAE